MSKVSWLLCDTCGEARWTALDTVCTLTKGCPGRMSFYGVPPLEGEVNGVSWCQQSLFETT